MTLEALIGTPEHLLVIGGWTRFEALKQIQQKKVSERIMNEKLKEELEALVSKIIEGGTSAEEFAAALSWAITSSADDEYLDEFNEMMMD